MGADLDHGPAEEVDDESEEADPDGGDVEVAVLDAIAGDSSGGLVAESIYEIQEVGPFFVDWMLYSDPPLSRCLFRWLDFTQRHWMP